MPRRNSAKSLVPKEDNSASAYDKVFQLLQNRLTKAPKAGARNLKTTTLLILVSAKIYSDHVQSPVIEQRSMPTTIDALKSFVKSFLFPAGRYKKHVDTYFNHRSVKKAYQKMLNGEVRNLVHSKVLASLTDRTGVFLRAWKRSKGFDKQWVLSVSAVPQSSQRLVDLYDSDGEGEEARQQRKLAAPLLHVKQFGALYNKVNQFAIFGSTVKHIRQRLLLNDHVSHPRHCEKTIVLLVVLLAVMRDEWRCMRDTFYQDLHVLFSLKIVDYDPLCFDADDAICSFKQIIQIIIFYSQVNVQGSKFVLGRDTFPSEQVRLNESCIVVRNRDDGVIKRNLQSCLQHSLFKSSCERLLHHDICFDQDLWEQVNRDETGLKLNDLLTTYHLACTPHSPKVAARRRSLRASPPMTQITAGSPSLFAKEQQFNAVIRGKGDNYHPHRFLRFFESSRVMLSQPLPVVVNDDSSNEQSAAEMKLG